MIPKQIIEELRLKIKTRVDEGMLTEVPWMVQETICRHGDVKGAKGEEWAMYCMYRDTKRTVKSAINKYGDLEQDDAQAILPGMEQLRVAYSMKREDGLVLVPIEQCTDEELEERAGQLEQISISCMKHADEIRIYLAARKSQTA